MSAVWSILKFLHHRDFSHKGLHRIIPSSFPAPFHGSDKMLGYALALAALWYFSVLLWRLRKGTAGVKPISDLVDRG